MGTKSGAKSRQNSSDVPQPPWRLSGEMVGIVGLIPVSVAERFVPDDLPIVRVLPGYTSGAIFVGNYSETSGGPYREVGFAPARVRSRGSRATWISHLYVDSEMAKRAGDEIWGLDKEMAEIEWTREQNLDGRERTEILLTHQGEEILHWTVTQQPIPLPGRFTLPITSRLGDRLLKWSTQIRSRVRKVHSEMWLSNELSALRPLPATAFAGELISAVATAPI